LGCSIGCVHGGNIEFNLQNKRQGGCRIAFIDGDEPMAVDWWILYIFLMDTQIIKNELEKLVTEGESICYALLATDKKYEAQLKEMKKDLKSLPPLIYYEKWYTEVLLCIKKFIPDRINDFIILYKDEKRKKLDILSYTISDAIQGITTNLRGDVICSPSSAYKKMRQQVEMLRSIIKIIDSKIFTYESEIRADLFDSEIDSATQLCQKGFLRAAGAICGVIIEKHLEQICIAHKLRITKRDPTINDFNEEIKKNNIIDIPTWRHLQLLADIRNICCHNKKQEPTKEQVQDLINGTKKVISTIF